MTRAWEGAWILFRLCDACAVLGCFDRLAVHAEDMRRLGGEVGSPADAGERPDLARGGRPGGGGRAGGAPIIPAGHALFEGLDSRDEICADCSRGITNSAATGRRP